MKAHYITLGAFAGLVYAQTPGTAEPTAIKAIDQCTRTAFETCPGDITAEHRCLKTETSAGLLSDQCVFSCPADSQCLSACGEGAGAAWCDVSGGCYCDGFWDSARAAPSDPADLSWVKKWAAVGDSYSAGIGSGEPYPNSSEACARYDHSYPAYIQSHDFMPQDPPAAFDYLSCSGATTTQVLDNQVMGMYTGYDVITVSAGGNDVGLGDLLNACVYQWNPFTSCPKELQKSLDLIQDVLPGNLDRLYAGLKDKVKPGRKIYVTGYATFFDNTTTLCDHVSWNFWYNVIDKQYLTSDRRTRMNELVLATNAAIQAAVQRAGDAFEYVGYDEYFTARRGRFCEAGVQEPDADRKGLLFFERSTELVDMTPLGRRKVAALELSGSEAGTAALQGRQADDDNGTEVSFEKYITNAIAEARAKNPSLVASPPDNRAFRARAGLSQFIGDDFKRVFHPQPAGHAIIANLVVGRMTNGTAAAQTSSRNATAATGAASVCRSGRPCRRR
ncbi:SGNH hydrolase [Colletotrichum eremochloae]|nr:SGNH hydrolase [Colletotrichum eremochloae]